MFRTEPLSLLGFFVFGTTKGQFATCLEKLEHFDFRVTQRLWHLQSGTRTSPGSARTKMGSLERFDFLRRAGAS